MTEIERTPRPGLARRGRVLLLLALACANPASANPLISEFFYDAVGSDNGQSFIELYGAPGTLLDGLTLEGVNGSNGAVAPVVSLVGTIGADGIFVVADDDGSGTTSVLEADQLANFDFQNGPDSVVLMDGGAVLDALGYGVFAPGEFFAGEGASAADAPAGSSLARVFANLDTDDNAFDFVVSDLPTPGTAPLTVPEPGTLAMAGAGLVGLGLAGRRKR